MSIEIGKGGDDEHGSGVMMEEIEKIEGGRRRKKNKKNEGERERERRERLTAPVCYISEKKNLRENNREVIFDMKYIFN